jgi:hypothetical protein
MEYTPEEVLGRVQKIIVHYNNKRDSITDSELEDLRAYLAVGTYLLIETNLQPAYADSTLAEMQMERMEGMLFDEYYNEYIKTVSPSIAMDRARKATKCDERYLQALKDHNTTRQSVFLLNKILDQANQVLNSMSKKSRH